MAAEIKRLEKQLAEKTQAPARHAGPSWTTPTSSDKAPAEVVQQQRDLVADLQEQIQAIEENLKELRAG